jgi:hypothetical protein
MARWFGGPPVATLPQPLRVTLNWPDPLPPPPSPGPDWSAPAKYQRDIAQWIVGGVLATAVALFAGSSLTRLGSLDFSHTPARLSLAIAGALLGFAAIGLFLQRALAVLEVEAGGVDDLVAPQGEWQTIANRINALFAFNLGTDAENHQRTVQMLAARRRDGTISDDDLAVLRRINAALGFLFVQHRFKRLIDCLPTVGCFAVLGFSLYAWAANPPAKTSVPEKGVTIKVVQ